MKMTERNHQKNEAPTDCHRRRFRADGSGAPSSFRDGRVREQPVSFPVPTGSLGGVDPEKEVTRVLPYPLGSAPPYGATPILSS